MHTYTVECHYSMLQHNMILHMIQQWLRQNMDQRLYSQETPHSSPSRASYGVSFCEDLGENWRYNVTALYIYNIYMYIYKKHRGLIIAQWIITPYCIQHCKRRTYIYKIHPIPHPLGWAMGCLIIAFRRKTDHNIRSLHCFMRSASV